MRRCPPPCRAAAAVAAVLIAAAGCTICPDPFDYSGPVPDGSAPQNDFRARANGISPIGGFPRPWPPVVRAAPTPEHDAAPAVVAAAEEPAPVTAAEAPDTVPAAATEPAPDTAAEAPDPQPVADEPAFEEILPPGPPPRPEAAPPLRETPGWKPRG